MANHEALTHSMDLGPFPTARMLWRLDPNAKDIEVIAWPWLPFSLMIYRKDGLKIRRIHGRNGYADNISDLKYQATSHLLNKVAVLPSGLVVKIATLFNVPEVLVHTGVAKSMDKSLLNSMKILVIENHINPANGLDETVRVYREYYKHRNPRGLGTCIMVDAGHVKQEFNLKDPEAIQKSIEFRKEHPNIQMQTHCALLYGGDKEGSVSLQRVSTPILIDFVTAYNDITVEHQFANPLFWRTADEFIFNTRRSIAYLNYARSLTS